MNKPHTHEGGLSPVFLNNRHGVEISPMKIDELGQISSLAEGVLGGPEIYDTEAFKQKEREFFERNMADITHGIHNPIMMDHQAGGFKRSEMIITGGMYTPPDLDLPTLADTVELNAPVEHAVVSALRSIATQAQTHLQNPGLEHLTRNQRRIAEKRMKKLMRKGRH